MPIKKYIDVELKKNGHFKINPSTRWIKPTGGFTVIWRCATADLKVDFDKNGSPFPNPLPFKGDAGTEDCESGVPTNLTEKAYRYSLTITPNPPIRMKGHKDHGDMQPFTIDPEVIIDENGPPGPKKSAKKKGGKKKGAKKKSARKVAKRAGSRRARRR